MKKSDLPACPVEATLTLIGNKWKVLILRDLMGGTRRFGELRSEVEAGLEEKRTSLYDALSPEMLAKPWSEAK